MLSLYELLLLNRSVLWMLLLLIIWIIAIRCADCRMKGTKTAGWLVMTLGHNWESLCLLTDRVEKTIDDRSAHYLFTSEFFGLKHVRLREVSSTDEVGCYFLAEYWLEGILLILLMLYLQIKLQVLLLSDDFLESLEKRFGECCIALQHMKTFFNVRSERICYGVFMSSLKFVLLC